MTRNALRFAGVAMMAAFVAHCGSTESLFGEGSGPCETVYKGRCGAPCASDDACPTGLHCAAGACTAECAASVACPAGLTCDARGRCTRAGAFTGSDGGGGGGGQGDACVDFDLTLAKVEPTIAFLIDQSGSMDVPFGDAGGTRWTVLKDALLSDAGVIYGLQSEVRFGLTMYGNAGGPGCPDLTTVPIALANHAAISGTYGPADTIPNTPTGESILAVAGITDAGVVVQGGLAALDAGGPKIILLATDGDPDTCQNPQANDPPLDPAEQQKAKDVTLAAVQRAFQAGIKTYVIAVGDEVSEVHQQEVANVGLGFAANAGDAAPYFRPSSQDELKANIRAIILSARECVYALNGSVQAGKEASGVVTLNGAPLAYGDPNGWKLRSPTELELTGAACVKVKTEANVTLSAKFPCGVVSGVR